MGGRLCLSEMNGASNVKIQGDFLKLKKNYFFVCFGVFHFKVLLLANGKYSYIQNSKYNFPGSPVAKTTHFQYRGLRFNP